ncbi:hypothetical protein K438DRAFT_1621123, partial [Mycena galopus ATCC 62051]
DRNSCGVCQKPLKDTERQNHTGLYILKAIRGVPDPTVKVPVSDQYPCGMCGGPTTNGACQVRIKGATADSDCPRAYSFQIKATAASRNTRTCTNVPVVCPLNCQETHWKYNLAQHFAERHPSWKALLLPHSVPVIHISEAEELAAGIPASKVLDWPVLALRPVTPQGTKRSLEQLQSPQRGKEKA